MGGHGFLPSGQVRFEAAPLWYLVLHAFEVAPQNADLAFAWSPALTKLRDEPFFEVVATAPPGSDTRGMMRTLLHDRFGLRYHREVRQVPVYALKVKEPGKLGRWLTPSPHNCREYIARGGTRNAPDSPRHGDRFICWPGGIARGDQRVEMGAGTMQDLIERVALPGVRAERPVIDETGLTGNFMWEVTGKSGQPGAIFVAFEDELGLTLERRIGPWEVIVIDEARMPTPN